MNRLAISRIALLIRIYLNLQVRGYSTLGAGFMVLEDGLPAIAFNVLNGTDTTATSGFNELFNDGVLIAPSLRWQTCCWGRPGHIFIAGTWNSRTYQSLGDAYIEYPNVVIPTQRGSWSLYTNFDHYLIVDYAKTLRGWGTFGRAGIADANTSPLAWFLSFGIGGSSPIRSHPADTFGVGWYYGGTSDQIGRCSNRSSARSATAKSWSVFTITRLRQRFD
jgi:porin